MIRYILTYLGGIATGVTLLLAHQTSVRRAVQFEQTKAKREADKLRAENARLTEDIAAYELSSEAARAREQGKIVGLREARNQSSYQRLEQSLNPGNRRTVQMGGGVK